MGKNKYYCRINGTIENLKDIQDILDGVNTENDITYLMYKNHGFEPLEALLFEDVIKFNNNEIPADYNECLKRMQDHNSARVNRNVPTCPTCGSSRIQKISATSKAANTMLFGIFGTKRHKTFKCQNCKYEW